MQRSDHDPAEVLLRASTWLLLLGMAAGLPRASHAQSWNSYGRDAQHDALASGPSQLPLVIRWSTPVDLDPQYAGRGALYIHYGSPVITAQNNILVPVKTGAEGGFQVNAFRAASGHQYASWATDYILPPHNWTPPMGITLTADGKYAAMPGAGGTVWLRSAPNGPNGTATRLAFFGIGNYNTNPQAFNNAIQICTPITSDESDTLYFGYVSTGASFPGFPNGIPSGLARVPVNGASTFIAAQTLAQDASIQQVTYNCAPALTADGSKLYIAVSHGSFASGYLCLVNSSDLTPINQVALMDPRNAQWFAGLPDDGTASPTIGPDGDVYFGVLEANFPSNHDRGWLLHFNSSLTLTKTPGAFGWDDSASIVPRNLVPSYRGPSSYLVLTKYNNYSDPGIGGNGLNKVAILDPNVTMPDPITGATVMNEVMTVLGPTHNPNLPGVNEWCINSAAVDPVNRCAIINSEDGHVYRWSFVTNTLSAGLKLAPPTGEAYTSTAIGPDGAVYAINNAVLFCCALSPGHAAPSRNGSAIAPGFEESFRPSRVLGKASLLALIALLVPLAIVAAGRFVRPRNEVS
jgi:hypothetical protein